MMEHDLPDELVRRANRNLDAMRADPDSDWPDRLATNMGRPATDRLSQVELEVLRLYANGLDFPDVARARGVSVWTVRTEMRSVRRKLAAKHSGHAAALAVRLGLIS